MLLICNKALKEDKFGRAREYCGHVLMANFPTDKENAGYVSLSLGGRMNLTCPGCGHNHIGGQVLIRENNWNPDDEHEGIIFRNAPIVCRNLQ